VIREVNLGVSIATQDGLAVSAKLALLPAGNGVKVEGYDWSIAIEGSKKVVYGIVDGPDIHIVLVRGVSATTSGTGFKPGTIARVYLFSDPIFLGEAIVQADGSFSATYPVSAHIALGNHTMQVEGLAKSGQIRKADVGLEVRAAAKHGLVILNILHYPLNVSSLTLGDKKILKMVAMTQKNNKYKNLMLYGFTDAQTGVDNVALSKARSEKARTYLQKLMPKMKIKIKYFAAANPVSKSRTSAAYAKNRRVEIYGQQ
jgi:outer membrane protein OmpA-like peptidoglycan-associated protein